MAEIQDVLRLSIDEALRDIGRVESALDRALAPVEVDIQVDERALAELENTLHEVQRIADRAATETQSIALAAGRAEVNFEDLARAMGITEAEARDLTAELLDAQAASNRLEDSARDVARQLGLSESEANRLTTSLRQADRAAEAIDVSTAAIATRFSGIRSAAAGVTGAFAAIGGAALFGGAIRSANAAVQSFAQLEDSVNAVNVIFGEGAAEVLRFGETAAASAGLSQQAFNQAVTPIGSLLQNFGFDAREAADAAVILVQRSADLASVLGGTVQDALIAVGAALRGESDPLERYGASISAARVEQFALAEGLAATKAEITDAIRLQARYGLILSDTEKVSGDFANTSGDLANAQRIAAAEAKNLVDQIGEALAPAFEAVLANAPAVLAFFDSLVPQLAATAENAAAAGAGLASFVSAVTLGFGQLGDVGGGVFDVLQTFPAVIEDIAAGIIDGDASFRNFRAQFDQFSQRTAQTFIRTASQSIPQAIAQGDSAVTAFGNAIAFLGRQDDNLNTIEQAFDRLRRVAGLTDVEAQAVTTTLIAQADALGLNADEVAFLNDQLDIFHNNLNVIGTEVSTAAREMAEFDTPFRTVTTTFTTFADQVEDGSDRASVALAELAAAAEREQARTEAAFNLFEDLPEKISGSFANAVDALRENVEAIAQFDINLALLDALGLDALADDFREKGIAAAGQLEQALNDIPTAIEADQILQGMGIIGEEAFQALVDKFVSVGLSPSDAKRLAESLSTPQVIQAAQDAATQVGTRTAIGTITSYREALIAEGAAMDTAIIERIIDERVATSFTADDQAEFAATETVDSYVKGLTGSDINTRVQNVFDSLSFVVDLFTEGQESRQTFLDGLSTAQANEERRLHDSIESTLNNAIQKRSPPKLFMDAGLESGEAFWSGFNQSNLTLKTALPGITGKIAEGSMPVAGAGSTEINFNLPNLETRDADVTIARATQLAGSVAGILNGNFKL